MKKYVIAVERWADRDKFVKWLEDNYGPEHIRWGVEQDFNLENLWMDEDIYVLYKLKWS
jgi:hypothetical protein